MRIGLFGGTFNPIHLGHLRVASEVAESFELTELIFIPSALPPHKQICEIAPPENRLEMTRLATNGQAVFTVSDVELNRSGFSYTIDTVRYLQKAFNDPRELFLIMGLDAFLEVDTWKSYKELFQLISVIIMERPNLAGLQPEPEGALLQFIRNKVSAAYRYRADEQRYSHPTLQSIYYFRVSLLGISGTKIRECIRNGRTIRYLVPDSVEKYIIERGLYR